MSTSPMRSRFPWILALPLALGLGPCRDRPAPSAPVVEPGPSEGLLFPPGHGVPLKFMSRNVYLGADLNPVIQAASQQPPNALAVLQAAAVAGQEVQDSRIPDRAAALAAEIERARPHLVGLREVFGFVEVDLTTTPPVPFVQASSTGKVTHKLCGRLRNSTSFCGDVPQAATLRPLAHYAEAPSVLHPHTYRNRRLKRASSS